MVSASGGAVSPLEWVVAGPEGLVSDSEYCEVLKRGGSGLKRSSKGSSQKMRKKSKKKNCQGNSHMRRYH